MNDFLQSLRNGQSEKPRAPKTRKNYDNSYQYSGPPRYHSYGNGGYQNRNQNNMKRPPMQSQNMPMGNQVPQEDMNNIALLADAIENLSSHVETLVKNQEYMANIQERASETLERQAMAIERLVEHLNITIPEAASVPVFENHYISSQEPEEHFEAPLPEKRVEKIEVKEIPKKRSIIRKRKKTVMGEPSSPAAIAGDGKLLSRETIMDIINSMRAEGATFDQVAKHLIDLGQPTFSGRGEWHAQTIHRLCSKK